MSGSGDRDFVTAPGFEDLAEAFDGQLERGLHYGAQLQVRYRGEVVLDRWGGSLGPAGGTVHADTPFMAYSATKPFTAVCIHRLVDEGRLDLDEPVARYWPSFAQRGKAEITVDQVLLHQAGIPGKASLREALAWPLPRGGARRACRMRPEYEPGTACHYHPFSAGFILGELVRRITGFGVADYLRKDFLEPLGMRDSYAGLPRSEYRRASSVNSGDPEQDSAALVFSNPLYRSLFLPAASLNTTARDLAVFYEMLRRGGEYEGRRYLRPERVAAATALAFDGPDRGNGRRIRWARGFTLGGYTPFPEEDLRMMGSRATEASFGGSGQGGCAIAWADPPSGLVFAFVCNRFLELKAAYGRFQELAEAAWKAV
jgi:CubicO group peptidase (beta-lactamase class C family)